MSITPQECETLLSRMEDADMARFLPLFGHELTVIARTAYEFQGPGVTDPRFLRDINEIQHRVFGQLMAIGRSNRSSYLPVDVLASWLLAENKAPRLKLEVTHAFVRAVQRFRAAA
ncbi:hypothetical protein [Pseudoxanthomonas beigongshangi]|uniref:hypothetical protein n=1 Tax=Pseudoxanthomonas beigongshangi TaxID=2782537 RepID=UPI00193C0298|nr:hypothetical protein [Pseudoxanthomonas beigongshangi]